MLLHFMFVKFDLLFPFSTEMLQELGNSVTAIFTNEAILQDFCYAHQNFPGEIESQLRHNRIL